MCWPDKVVCPSNQSIDILFERAHENGQCSGRCCFIKGFPGKICCLKDGQIDCRSSHYTDMHLPVIINQTTIRGDDLRRLVQRTYRALDCENRLVWPWRRIEFKPSADYKSHGLAYLEDGLIEINVARGFVGSRDDTSEIAALTAHEVYHLCGLEHNNMPAGHSWWLLPTPWADGLKLRLKKTAAVADIEARIRKMVDILALSGAA